MADVEMQDTAGEGVQRRGRGFGGDAGSAPTELLNGSSGQTAGDSTEFGSNAARSVEGWIIICTGVHEEASEDDVMDLFSEYGKVMNLHLNLDRRTGYVKGYALIEYATKKEAEDAIKGTNGTQFLEQTIKSDFAFTKPPAGLASRISRPTNGAGPRSGRRRSVSPQARV